jgi:type II secretory pathway component PulF
MSNGLSWKIRNAAFDFKGKRGDFYLDLASVMEANRGEPVAKILAKYADRYKGQSIGILCAHWLERFQEVGTFSESLRGTVPDEDLASLTASEAAGDLRLGLEKLATIVIAMGETKGEMWKSMLSALMLIAILHIFLGLESFMVVPKLEAAMKGSADISQMGKAASLIFGGGKFIRDWWWAWVVFVVALTTLTIWALKNYTGKARTWLDNNILPFQVARDFNAAQFFSALGAITTPRGGQVVQLNDALMQLQANAFPWLRWQTKLIIENISSKPNSKGEVFDTGIADKKTYYRILDISDYNEVSVMLQKVGDIILKTAPVNIRSRANKLRIVLMAVCLVTMIGIYGGTASLIESFKAAAQLKAIH